MAARMLASMMCPLVLSGVGFGATRVALAAEQVTVTAEDGRPWTMVIAPQSAGTAGEFSAGALDVPELAQGDSQEGSSEEDAFSPGVGGAQPAILPPMPEAYAPPEVHVHPAAVVETSSLARRYRAVYNSIPFNRAEYLANPGYRHDATMEFLFNELRPTTIVKQYEPKIAQPNYPTLYRPYIPARWDYWRFPWSYRGAFAYPFGY